MTQERLDTTEVHLVINEALRCRKYDLAISYLDKLITQVHQDEVDFFNRIGKFNNRPQFESIDLTKKFDTKKVHTYLAVVLGRGDFTFASEFIDLLLEQLKTKEIPL